MTLEQQIARIADSACNGRNPAGQIDYMITELVQAAIDNATALLGAQYTSELFPGSPCVLTPGELKKAVAIVAQDHEQAAIAVELKEAADALMLQTFELGDHYGSCIGTCPHNKEHAALIRARIQPAAQSTLEGMLEQVRKQERGLIGLAINDPVMATFALRDRISDLEKSLDRERAKARAEILERVQVRIDGNTGPTGGWLISPAKLSDEIQRLKAEEAKSAGASEGK